MNFYQLHEAITAQQTNLSMADFHNIVRQVWNTCFTTGSGGYITCEFEGRILGFQYSPFENIVAIAYMWSNDNNAAPSSFTNALTLQQGSIAGLHKFKEFISRLKPYGIRIGFTAEGKRERMYDKILTSIGYVQVRKGLYEVPTD